MSTAGYSGTPLPRKLGMREGSRVLLVGAPDGFAATLGELPPASSWCSRARVPSTWRCSSHSTGAVDDRFAGAGGVAAARRRALDRLAQAQFRRRGRPRRERVREIGLAAGLVDNKVCAIDATWSGLRFVWRLRDRPS